jgi:hypothetical protein
MMLQVNCMFYTVSAMTRVRPPRSKSEHSLSVELGGWFKANATGAGVIAIPVMVLLLAALGLAQGWLG